MPRHSERSILKGKHSGRNITVKDVLSTNESSAIKSESDYANAQKHVSDAQLLFLELIPLVNSTSPHEIVEVQSGLIMYKNMVPYNLAEDVVQNPILNHLNKIVQLNATGIQ